MVFRKDQSIKQVTINNYSPHTTGYVAGAQIDPPTLIKLRGSSTRALNNRYYESLN